MTVDRFSVRRLPGCKLTRCPRPSRHRRPLLGFVQSLGAELPNRTPEWLAHRVQNAHRSVVKNRALFWDAAIGNSRRSGGFGHSPVCLGCLSSATINPGAKMPGNGCPKIEVGAVLTCACQSNRLDPALRRRGPLWGRGVSRDHARI